MRQLSILPLILGLMAPGVACAAEDCGPVRPNMWDKYPVDYRQARVNFNVGQLISVAEFTHDVKTPKGAGGLLLYVPNHPVALQVMGRFADKAKSPDAVIGGYTMNCWYDRAVRWSPDDMKVRKLYGAFLTKRGRAKEALTQFLEVQKNGGDSPDLSYNLGLLYFETEDYDAALKNAWDAYAGGFRFPALKEKLEKAGKWRDPPEDKTVVPATPPPQAAVPDKRGQEDDRHDVTTQEGLRANRPLTPPGEDCGQVRADAHDHRTDTAYLPFVENRHFTYEVEHLIRGSSTGRLPDDITYLLDSFPNHHRGLVAMMRFLERNKFKAVPGSKHSMACWLDRAVRWRPDDPVVRSIYGAFLLKQGQDREAVKQYELAVLLGRASAENCYNVGLVYFRLGEYEKSLEWAHKAYDAGSVVPGLRNMLTKAGKWKDAAPSPRAEGAGPMVGGIASQPDGQTPVRAGSSVPDPDGAAGPKSR